MYDVLKLNIGDVIKDYPTLCRLINAKHCSGRQKVYQLEDFQRYFNWEKDGRNFIITEIYEIPIVKKKKQNNLGHYRRKDNYIYNVNPEDNVKKGVYKIQLHKKVYIGSTTQTFRIRFNKHVNGWKTMPHTKTLLDEGGCFEILWIAKDNDTEQCIRHMEQHFIDEYYKNGYELINENLKVKIKGEKRSSKKATKRIRYKNIKIKEQDFDKCVFILEQNGINVV